MSDANNAVAGRLRSGCNDAQFLADHCVQERGLAHVRPSHQGCKTTSEFVSHLLGFNRLENVLGGFLLGAAAARAAALGPLANLRHITDDVESLFMRLSF